MYIGRNEKCPCASGKKFKNCCINDPKFSSTKLNNGLARKYMSEFALHSFSSTVAICYPNNLDKVNITDENYHIYMVHKIPRLSIIGDSVEIYRNHIEMTIQLGVLNNVTTNTIKFSLIEGNHKEVYKCEVLSDKRVIIRNDKGGGIDTDVLTLYQQFSNQPLDSKVLYVGQSYGKAGERDAIQRLSSHSTLQAILADTLSSDIEHEIAITLWEFSPRLITSFDGISKDYLSSSEEDLEHLRKVTSNPPLWLDNEIVNITEAALINYFKPEYNEKFKNNFPNITHKGYRYYYDYDFNAICVELDPTCINTNIFSESKEYTQFKPIKYQLNSEEERRSMFDIDFSSKRIREQLGELDFPHTEY